MEYTDDEDGITEVGLQVNDEEVCFQELKEGTGPLRVWLLTIRLYIY
jgi:hypothetical protein